VARRRSGPADEDQWWEPADQAFVQAPVLNRRDFPKGWRPIPMVNNVEVLDPYAGEGAAAIRAARAARVLSALDEGVAYRARNRQLLVLRIEAFADPDETAHRQTWLSDGPAALTATYQVRWSERDVVPNWIETRIRRPGDVPTDVDPRIDWLRVEDHTDPKRLGTVSIYEHLTLWCGRGHAVITLRHELDQQVDDVARKIAEGVLTTLEGLPRLGGGAATAS